MSLWALALVLPAALVAIVNWRYGMYAMLVVAFLQDPLRKLEVDQPVYFTLLAGLVIAITFVRAQSAKSMWPTQIAGWNHYMRRPSIVLLLLFGIQAGVSIIQYGNPMIAAIGAVSYLAPLPALLLGYHFALRTGVAGIRRWLGWYLIGAIIVVPSILLEYAGVEWPTLGQVGIGFEMYINGAILTAHSGFFRASETAAWHTATAVCFLLLLSSMQKLSTRQIFGAVVVIVALLTIGVLTGRRKIFVEIVIFLSVYLSLLLKFRKGGVRLAAAVFLGGIVCYAAMTWLVVEGPDEFGAQGATSYQYYAERSATVTGDISDRVLGLGLAPVEWAVDRFGWFGGGLGVASQGAQYFGGGGEVFGGAGEGGLGKITAELGVPGLFLFAWFALSALRLGWKVLQFVSERSPAVARLAYGLIAFLIANLSVFFVATQVFGDMFVLLLLGLVAGFFLATPALAERARLQPTQSRAAPTRQHPRYAASPAIGHAQRRP